MNLKELFGKKHKYRAKKVVINNITFDSKKEADRYQVLVMLEKGGKISDLKIQPKFVLQDAFYVGSKKYLPITYTADFTYYDSDSKKEIVEEVKGFKTDDYRIRKKMFLKRYGGSVKFIES
ncbi:MAG: DUF1064 domain-containing protein [Endomicrobium sp.]|jgi:hypothetical protein|nr:DUF1064 domain-containing protein [Endomicrobium sp.]